MERLRQYFMNFFPWTLIVSSALILIFSLILSPELVEKYHGVLNENIKDKILKFKAILAPSWFLLFLSAAFILRCINRKTLTDWRWILFLTFFYAFALRICLAFTFYGTHDVEVWEQVSKLMSSGKDVYLNTDKYNYPPPWMWVIHFTGTVCKYTHLPFFGMIKLPLILADIGITYLIYKTFRNLSYGERESCIMAGLYAFNPISILISSRHGQTDPLFLFCCILAWYVFNNRKGAIAIYASSILLGIGISLKVVPIILLPAFLWKIKTMKQRFYFCLLAAVPTLLSMLPFLMSNPEEMFGDIFFNTITAASYSRWWGYTFALVIIERTASFIHLNMLSNIIAYINSLAVSYGTDFLLAMLIYLYVFVIKPRTLVESIIIIFVTFYSFTVGFSLQYMIWIVPFAIINRESASKYYTITVTLGLLMYYFSFGYIPPYYLKIYCLLPWLVCCIWMLEKLGNVQIFSYIDRKILSVVSCEKKAVISI